MLGWRRRKGFAERLVAHARTEAWGGSGAASLNVPGLENLGTGGGAGGGEEAAKAAQPAMNRRERRLQAREDEKERRTKRNRSRSASGVGARKDLPPSAPGEPAPEGAVKRVTALNGKPLIVDSNDRVFLVEGGDGGSSDDEDEPEEVEPMLYLLSPEAIEKPTLKDTVLWRLPAWTVGKLRERAAQTSKKAQPAEKQEEAEADAGNFVVVEKEDGQGSGDGLGAQETATGRQGGGKQRKRKGKGR